MKKKNIGKKIAVTALATAFALGGTSCTMFMTDSDKDMAQTIATVDITKSADYKAGGKYADYASVVKNVDGTILKRDLIAYFMNVGSQYVSSYGYKQTFTMLLDTLVTRKIMVQYAMTWYLSSEDEEYTADFSVEKYNAYMTAQKAENEEFKNKEELLTLVYFLTENGTKPEKYDQAEYSLKAVVNKTLDQTEASYIEEETGKDETFGADRATPTGVGTEKEDYYDANYEIYSGHNTVDSCGSYEKLDGSTQYTRRKAYNDFLSNLSANNLIESDEETKDFTKLAYYYEELTAQVEQAFITKFSEDLETSAADELNQTYLENKFNDLKASQQRIYDGTPSAFETAIGSISDDAFVVYNPRNGFGFVYNILIPFSATDTQTMDPLNTAVSNTTDKTKKLDLQKQLYTKRAELLTNVKAKDLRSAWFSNNKDKNYSYKGTAGEYYTSDYNSGEYLFFEDNFTKTDRYEEIKQYLGKYPYNGTVKTNADGEFESFKPNALQIDDFIKEMESYINYAVDSDKASGRATGAKYANYVDDGNYTIKDGDFKYEEFMYYTGKVTLSDKTLDNYFVKETPAYNAASAVNELMFAYSTDTGCFNTYMGYAVSPISDKYVKEFAYAAQYAVGQQEGSYAVCSSQYGWHILYVTESYGVGDVYENGFVWAEKDTEGTFSHLWFEAVKASTSDLRMEKVHTDALAAYNNDTSVKKYQSRYQDLLELDA